MPINSTEIISYDQIKQAADYVQANTKHRPKLGLIEGILAELA